MGSWLAAAALLAMSPSHGKRPQVISVTVTNPRGEAIPNAWVRVPGAEGRRAVDPETGLWEASTLYDAQGVPLIFVRGMELSLTVTAPGYRPKRIAYRVRARGNRVTVALEPMPVPAILPQGVDSLDVLMKQWFEAPRDDLTSER